MPRELKIKMVNKTETLNIFQYDEGLASIALNNNKTGEDYQTIAISIKPMEAVAIAVGLLMWAGRQA